MRERAAGTYLVDDTVVICLVVGQGSGKATAWGSDLSDQYVRINADYTTRWLNRRDYFSVVAPAFSSAVCVMF